MAPVFKAQGGATTKCLNEQVTFEALSQDAHVVGDFGAVPEEQTIADLLPGFESFSFSSAFDSEDVGDEFLSVRLVNEVPDHLVLWVLIG